MDSENGRETARNYVSCIKVNGNRILPPLLNDELRAEMRYYRKLAIAIEQKLSDRRALTDSSDCDKSTTYSEKSSTYESERSNESFHNRNVTAIEVPLCDVPRENVQMEEMSIVPVRRMFSPSLRQESYTLESESTVFPEQVLKDFANTDPDVSNCDSAMSDNGATVTDENQSTKTAEKPQVRLIRSDSFTIDTPSPMLLAHLKKTIKSPTQQKSPPKSKKRRSWDLKNAKKKWSSIENDIGNTSFTHSKYFSLPPSPNSEMFDTEPHRNLKRTPPKALNDSQKRFLKGFVTPVRNLNLDREFARRNVIGRRKVLSESPRNKTETLRKPNVQLFQRQETYYGASLESAEVIHISTTANGNFCDNMHNANNNLSGECNTIALKTDNYITSQDYIYELFDKIQKQQSKQMSELLARQKTEQENLVKIFARQQNILITKIQEAYQQSTRKVSPDKSEISLTDTDVRKSEELVTECKRFLWTDGGTTLNGSSDTLADPNLSLDTDPSPENACRAIESARRLFPVTAKTVRAATKICALGRGFLVRRLMRTERVQDLIKTIKDALVVAMSVHGDAIEEIQPADVEFHRHLIQQITAACHEFHSVFFDLSTTERMYIISKDRDRLKEKQLRPTSARSAVSLSSATQRVIQRKLRRDSSGDLSVRSCRSAGAVRSRTRSVSNTPENMQMKRDSPQSCPIRRTMSFGANKKPWR